ncbi:MAG: 1-acyl-sn-glycerol-3-phosphate acyltransferase [Acidithiobacillus sp.]
MLIIVRPHTSLLDGPAVALWLTRERQLTHCLFAVDPDYARHPVYSFLLKTYGWLVGRHTLAPLDQQRPFALRKMFSVLKKGRHVVIFPQGTGLADTDRPDQAGMNWLLRKADKEVSVLSLNLCHDQRWPRVTITPPTVAEALTTNRSPMAITR